MLHWLRSWLPRKTGTISRRPSTRRLLVEALEDRVMPALGTPAWVEQGPGPIANGQVEGMAAQNNPVAGAVEAIAAHPTDPNFAVVGTVNGGIWITGDATSATPFWSARTDNLPSLSVSAIAYSPVDPQVLYAGTGSFSSGASAGGQAIGVLKSIDGGFTWNQVGGTTLNGFRIRSILPTTLGGGQVVLVGAQNAAGLYRSVDGGATFTKISGTGGLPLGASCFSIVADGADPNIFYASVGIGVSSQGVFRSVDGGVTWTNISAGLTGLGGAAVRIELAAHYDAADSSRALYCAVIAQANGGLSGLFRSTDRGATWTAMDAIQTNEGSGNFGLQPEDEPVGDGTPEDPGGQGSLHFSMVADKTNEFVVYVGGDRQPAFNEGTANPSFPNSIGANNYSGRHFRGDASQAAGSQWYAIDAVGLAANPSDGANGTSGHADSRELVFDAAGNLLEGDDGGIYRLSNPGSVTRTWSAVTGNLRVTEFYSVAYDSLNNVIFGGTQDVGSPRQDVQGLTPWTELQQGDGGVSAVDVTSTPGSAIAYNSFQNLGGFTRRTYDTFGNLTNTTGVGTVVNGTGGQTLRQVDASIQFIQPYLLNAIDPTRMLIGTNDLYESFDRGDTLTDLNYGGTGGINAMAYGGRLAGVANPEVIYAAAGATLRLRTTAGGAFTALTAYTGSTIRDIAIDPDNWQRAYVLDSQGRVWRTTNAGTSFTNITSNLLSLLPAGSTDLRTIEFYSRDAVADIGDAVFVGGLGGVYGTDNPQAGAAATWVEFGTGLPNYLVRDLHYDRTDDVLLVGGFGRGAWTVPNASVYIAPETTVILDANNNLVVTDVVAGGKNDNLRISRFGNNLQVSDSSRIVVGAAGTTQVDTHQVTIPYASVSGAQGVIVNTGGGSDTLTIDFSGFGFDKPLTFNAGGNTGDTLIFSGNGGNTDTYVYSNATDGNVQRDPDGPGGILPTIITYTGLALLRNPALGPRGVFFLPTTADDFTLMATKLQSNNATFVTTEFSANLAAATIINNGGADILRFQGKPLGNATFNGGGDTDRIVGADFPTQWVLAGPGQGTMTMPQSAPPQAVSLINVEELVGGTSNDALIGNNANNRWNLTGPGSGNILGVLNSFSGMENLSGNAGNDAFLIGNAGSVAGTISGGDGVDAIVGPNLANVWNLTGAFQGNLAGVLPNFAGIEQLIGGSAMDTLTAANAVNVWSLVGVNLGSVAGLSFGGMENLVGNANIDYFILGSSGGVTGSINGAGGSDWIFGPNANRVWTMTAPSAGNVAGVNAFASIENLMGGTAIDTLVGDNAARTWIITSAGGGAIPTLLAGFFGFEHLTGGAARDIFQLGAAGSLAGILSGGGGGDFLDYSARTTSVAVNLTSGGASFLGAVQNVQHVLGSAAGGDLLIGSALGSILVAHGAGNTLVAGGGRSILIGGYGFNNLVGGAADDILINGITSFDANIAGLANIFSTWQGGLGYPQRVAALQGTFQIGATVIVFPGQGTAGGGARRPGFGRTTTGGTLVENMLTGNGGLDWFITNSLTSVVDRQTGETVTTP